MDRVASTLFGKTRQAVLAHLFDRPDRAWYLRELARQTGISPGALQHEFAQLVDADLVSRAADGNRVRYRANTLHPIFDDLQSIVRKTCGPAARIKAALSAQADLIVFAAIYGSLAKGGGHAASDVDVLIVGELGFEQAVQLLAPLEAELSREISIRLYSLNEFRQKRQQADNFLSSVLAGELQVLLGALDDA